MKLNNLPKLNSPIKKRLGRGIGSGRGKTSGRGMKGANSRGKLPLGFVGSTLPLYKKLPYKRGLGNTKISAKLRPLDVSKLDIFKKGETVDLQSLVERGLVSAKEAKKSGVKIVGSSDLKVALTIKLPVTQSARATIEKVGGTVS